MKMHSRRHCLALGAGALGLASLGAPKGAQAHRMDVALTRMDWREDRGSLDITHQLYTHDLEHVFELGAVGVGYFESAQGQAIVVQYAADRFKINLPDGTQFPLRTLGAEVSGDVLYIYQDGPLAPLAGVAGIEIYNALLMDVIADQSNLLNFHRNGAVNSLTFRRGIERQYLGL